MLYARMLKQELCILSPSRKPPCQLCMISVFFCGTVWQCHCGGLNENGVHSLIYLSVCPYLVKQFVKNLEKQPCWDVALLELVCHLKHALEISKAHYTPQHPTLSFTCLAISPSLCLWIVRPDLSSQVLPQCHFCLLPRPLHTHTWWPWIHPLKL